MHTNILLTVWLHTATIDVAGGLQPLILLDLLDREGSPD